MNPNRVLIGRTFNDVPLWKLIIGIPLIYLPAFLVLPFVIIGVNLVRGHLRFMGAKNLKKYKEFVPSKKSFRYSLDTQITMKEKSISIWLRSKIYWFYNCGIYCPYSVALFEYSSYLVKVVENWWCPFHHDKKENYADASIDQSFWHVQPERVKLHKDDLENPIWNDEGTRRN